jgi:hypothetical protein
LLEVFFVIHDPTTSIGRGTMSGRNIGRQFSTIHLSRSRLPRR